MLKFLFLFLPLFTFAQSPVDQAFLAAEKGDVRSLKILVRKLGVSPSAQKGSDSLIFFSKDLKTARFLFKEGAALSNTQGKTMLMQAAALSDDSMIKFFLKYCGAKACDYEKWTALHYLASGKGKVSSAKLLTAAGADINAVDDLLWTPLMHAAYRGNAPLTAFFIEAGADIKALNKAKKSASALASGLLPFAVNKDDYKEVIRLLEEGRAQQ